MPYEVSKVGLRVVVRFSLDTGSSSGAAVHPQNIVFFVKKQTRLQLLYIFSFLLPQWKIT